LEELIDDQPKSEFAQGCLSIVHFNCSSFHILESSQIVESLYTNRDT